MFVTSGQFTSFLFSVSFGIVFGVFWGLIRLFFRSTGKLGKGIGDVIFFIFLSLSFTYFAYLIKFPNIRLYMIAGILLGIFLYMKSFNIILANVLKKVYNLSIKKILNKRKRGKTLERSNG